MESFSFYLCASNYKHPDIVSGQHTNGNPNVFVRKFGSNDWYLVNKHAYRSMHAVRTKIGEIGIDTFLVEHCVLAENN